MRENYPDAPLLIASWDFIGWQWTDKGVQNLIKEFDPEKTILLDYTADKNDKVTYRDWDVYKKFPWIFGIFHGFAKNSDIHEDYKILTPRLQEVIDDEKCVGLVAWSEISPSCRTFWTSRSLASRTLAGGLDFCSNVAAFSAEPTGSG